DMHQKMVHIRDYARSRLKEGERLWWLDEGADDQPASAELQDQVNMNLPQAEKRKLRAEGALLCPQICAGGRYRTKYTDVVMYMLTVRRVLAPQARDLFSAGSVAGKERGGNYIARALHDIQREMQVAAHELDDALF